MPRCPPGLRRPANEHGLGGRERLLQAGLLHDTGVFVSLRAHHKHSHACWRPRIFG
jgi:hypothetical protein